VSYFEEDFEKGKILTSGKYLSIDITNNIKCEYNGHTALVIVGNTKFTVIVDLDDENPVWHQNIKLIDTHFNEEDINYDTYLEDNIDEYGNLRGSETERFNNTANMVEAFNDSYEDFNLSSAKMSSRAETEYENVSKKFDLRPKTDAEIKEDEDNVYLTRSEKKKKEKEKKKSSSRRTSSNPLFS
jgi:uncharacterized membrane-anchored protein YhcB (DUF1043 family)